MRENSSRVGQRIAISVTIKRAKKTYSRATCSFLGLFRTGAAMFHTKEVVVNFRLHGRVPAGHVPCIMGSSRELGSWDPSNTKIMNRNLHNEQEWHKRITFQRRPKIISYRFFVCKLLMDPSTIIPTNVVSFEMDSDVVAFDGAMIYKWEQPIECRPFNLSELAPHYILPMVDLTMESQPRYAKQWLINITEFRLRFMGDCPIRFADTRLNAAVCGIRCIPINCKEVMKGTSSIDCTKWGSALASGTAVSRFVAISKISVASYRKLIGPKGISRCPEYHNPEMFKSTEISVARVHPVVSYDLVPQQPTTIPYRNGQFLSFHIFTVTQSTLGLRFEFYKDVDGIPKFFAAAFLLPFENNMSFKVQRAPIFGLDTTCVGELSINCLIIKPFADQHLGNQKSWSCRKSFGKAVPARDMFNSHGFAKIVALKENTIASLKAASLRESKYIQIVVQLSKDKVPVIYHDFNILVSSYNRSCQASEVYQMAVRDLDLDMLHSTKLTKLSKKARALPDKYTDTVDTEPFPSLAAALRADIPAVGFIIVVKYPQRLNNGALEVENYFDQNTALDTILSCVEKNNCASRDIVYTTSNADTCIMLQQKQSRCPVLFRCEVTSTKRSPYADFRCASLELALFFAASERLFGVDLPAEELIRDPDVAKKAHTLGLSVFTWTDSNLIDREIYRTHADAFVCEQINFWLDEDGEREIFHLSNRQASANFPKTQVMTVKRFPKL